MTAILGHQALYQISSGRFLQAEITKIHTSTTDLIVLNDGAAWGDGYDTSLASRMYLAVTEGTGVGEWQAGTMVEDLIASHGIDLTSIAFVTDDGTAQTLTSGTPRKPNDNRPTFIEIVASFTWNLTAIGTQTGSIVIKNDDQNPPTTVTHTIPFSRGVGVGLTVSDTGEMPFGMGFWVRPGNYYSITTTGAVTFTLHENQF